MKWYLIMFCFMMISIASCFGSCSQYTDKVNCTNTCACCWGILPTGEYIDGYPVVKYQCRWDCSNADDYDHQYNPTLFCSIVNKSVVFALFLGMFLLFLLGLLLIAAIGLLALMTCMFGCRGIEKGWETYIVPFKEAYPRVYSVIQVIFLSFIAIAILGGVIRLCYPILSVLFS